MNIDHRPTSRPLSRNERRVLDYMRQFYLREGHMPTSREVQRGMHFASQTSVMRAIAGLEAKGQLRRSTGTCRTTKLAQEEGRTPVLTLSTRLRLIAGRTLNRQNAETMLEAADRLEERAFA